MSKTLEAEVLSESIKKLEDNLNVTSPDGGLMATNDTPPSTSSFSMNKTGSGMMKKFFSSSTKIQMYLIFSCVWIVLISIFLIMMKPKHIMHQKNENGEIKRKISFIKFIKIILLISFIVLFLYLIYSMCGETVTNWCYEQRGWIKKDK